MTDHWRSTMNKRLYMILIEASRGGNTEVVDSLLRQNPNIDVNKAYRRDTPLFVSALHGQT